MGIEVAVGAMVVGGAVSALTKDKPKKGDYAPGPHVIMSARRSLADFQRHENIYGTARTHMWERARTDRAAIGRGIASADIQQGLGKQGLSLANTILPIAAAEDIQKRSLAMGDVTSKARGQTLSAQTDLIASAQNQRIVADKGYKQLGSFETGLGIGEARTKRASKKLVSDAIVAGTMQMAGGAKERMDESIWDLSAGPKGAFRRRGVQDFFTKDEGITGFRNKDEA